MFHWRASEPFFCPHCFVPTLQAVKIVLSVCRDSNAVPPPAECLTLPHLGHAVIALACALLYMGTAFLLACANFDFSLVSSRLLAMSHPMVEIRSFVWKTTMVCACAFFGDSRRLQALLMFGGAFMLAHDYIRYVSAVPKSRAHLQPVTIFAICTFVLSSHTADGAITAFCIFLNQSCDFATSHLADKFHTS